MRRLAATMIPTLLFAGSALAQEVSVPAVTTASPGGYANPLKLDTDRYDRQRRQARSARTTSSACSADALPAAERRAMEREYLRRSKADGRASADEWVREQGRLFRARLARQGVCPPEGNPGRTTAATGSSRRATPARPSGRKGGKCTKTVMQARNIANPGGGAMSMIMVPVCVN